MPIVAWVAALARHCGDVSLPQSPVRSSGPERRLEHVERWCSRNRFPPAARFRPEAVVVADLPEQRARLSGSPEPRQLVLAPLRPEDAQARHERWCRRKRLLLAARCPLPEAFKQALEQRLALVESGVRAPVSA